jgi:regulation of enolase protein 1 (concanavalin A-like superfamily)
VEPAGGDAGGFFYAPQRPHDQATAGGEQDPVVAELRRIGAKLVAKGARGSWSPDAKRIAVGKMPFGSGVWLVQVVGLDEDASAPRIPLVFGQPAGAVTEFLPDGKDPAWSPDGKWIAFTREVGSGAGATEEVWLTGADRVVRGKPVPVSQRRLGTGVMATWSADATTVFFSNPQTRDILSLRVDKPAEPVVVWKAIGDQFPDLWYPVVAPNGRYVAYHADGRLKIADMTSQKIVGSWPLDGWRGWLGGWSSDGTRLGYGAFGGEDKGLWELSFVILGKPALSQPRRILNGSCTLPCWSADGSKLAFDFRSPQRGYEVWTMDVKRPTGASTSATSEDFRASARVYPLRHVKAEDVVQAIHRMLGLGGQSGTDSRMSIGADLRMNAVVVSGDAKTLETVEKLLNRLDGAQQQPGGAASTAEGRKQAPADKYKVGICALEQAIAKLQHDVALAEDKARAADAAVREAGQAEKVASAEAKTAALLRRLKAEAVAEREADALRKIRQEFLAACKAYKQAIAAAGTDGGGDAPPAGRAGVPGETDAADFTSGGLGVELEIRNGVLLIIRVIPGSPAERDGLRAGDKIVAIDGRPTDAMAPAAAVSLLRGPVGTTVQLRLLDPTGQSRTQVVRREQVLWLHGFREQKDPSPVTAWPVAAFDGFDGRLALPWKPIRHDPTHVSLEKHPGKLTIITQRGSIHGDEKHDDYGGGIQAKNLFLIDNPFCNGEDFAMTTCVENFTPQTPYQQAGLICYDDDDNYLKFGYEFCWQKGAGHAFTCVREIDQKPDHDLADAKSEIAKYWLRIVKRGNKYQYAYSYDGEHYVTVGEREWANGKPKKLGLLAKNGGNPDAPELECQFDFLQLQCPHVEKSINWDRGGGERSDGARKGDKAGTLRPIKLGAKANQELKKSFNEGGPDNSLAELPQGPQELGGVKFEIGPSCIRLRGNQRPKLPQAAEGIPVGFCFDKLHLLHATEFGAFGDESHPFFVKDGTPIGDYKIHYADGSNATIPIVYGEDVRDWWYWEKSKDKSLTGTVFTVPAGVKRGKVVWTGKNADAGQYDVPLRLYLTTWDNPKPKVQVTTIDYVSVGQTAAGPFCVAITAHTAETGTDPSPAASSAEAGSSVVTVYYLKYAKAETTVQVLASIFAGQENFRIVADARTNGIVVFGTSEQQKKIQEVIRSLDVPAPAER